MGFFCYIFYQICPNLEGLHSVPYSPCHSSPCCLPRGAADRHVLPLCHIVPPAASLHIDIASSTCNSSQLCLSEHKTKLEVLLPLGIEQSFNHC